MRYLGPSGESARYDWWNSNQKAVANDMLSCARTIARNQQYIYDQMLWLARMHGGANIAGLTPSTYQRVSNAVSSGVYVGDSIGLNVIENICESAQAEICQEKPKATFLTDRGDWEMRQRSEKLDRFCEGLFYELDVYRILPDVVLDGVIFGTGAVKVYENDGQIAVERIFPWELLVDASDGAYRKPRQMFHYKHIDRDVLIGLYPSKREAIKNAKAYPISAGRETLVADSVSDLVQVVESWRLPSAKGKADGRHVIAVDGAALVDEPWKRDAFPFSFYRWTTRPAGFWGKGITEQIAGIQKEINRLLIKIQRAFARLGITRVFLERGSKVNPAHLRANDGDIIEYTGRPPQQVTPPIVSPEIFNHLWTLERKAYEVTGVSQMTAQGAAPPPGVDSGRAIRTLLQNHSKRMIAKHDEYADLAVDIADKMIDLAREMAERPEGFSVRFPTTEGGYEEIDFRDVDLSRDKYVIKRFPTSSLPTHPGERLQALQELFNSGLIDGETFMYLADFPDLKAASDLNVGLANRKAITRRLTDVVKEGVPWVPDGWVNLKLAKELSTAFLINAEMDHVPEDRLDLLRQTIDQVVQLEQAAAAPPPPPPGAPQQAAPQGAPPGQPIPGMVAPLPQTPNPLAAPGQ